MSDSQKIEGWVQDEFQVIKKLGSGAYGHVWKVRRRSGEEPFALKKIFQAFQHDTDAQRTFREISVLRKIQHPNIIRLFEVMPSRSGRDIYLVFQYMSTDLHRAIYQGSLEELHRKYITYQLLIALYYLHSARLIHRDLKPSNLLLDQACSLRICDFGLVRLLEGSSEESVLTQGVATRWYRAPEVLLGSRAYDQKADMWSVGCILAEMITKSPLFPGNSTLHQLERILQFTGRPSSDQLEQLSPQVAELVFKQSSQTKARGVRQFFGASTDTHCVDLITKLLCFGGKKRLTAAEALRHPYVRQFFNSADLVEFKGTIELETSDNKQLGIDQYRQLIAKYLLGPKNTSKNRHISLSPLSKEPQRFSDLKKRDKSEKSQKDRVERVQHSFGRLIQEMHNRKGSSEKGNSNEKGRRKVNLFQEILKQNSLKQSRLRSESGNKGKQNNNGNIRQRVGVKENKNLKIENLKTGTFGGLKKVGVAGRFQK